MNVKKIWFNHWFSTVYHIINMIKDDEINFYIIGTNERPNAVYKSLCDEFYVEPTFNNTDDYIDYCLNFCKKNKIEIFFPRRNLLEISKKIAEFNSIGTKVFIDNYSEISTFNDKEKTYKFFTDKKIGHIPNRYTINNIDDFKNAYKKLKTDNNRLCIKFANDEGAKSFRVIDNSKKGLNSLYSPSSYRITYNEICDILIQNKIIPDLIIMPFLEGTEVSVDCLKTSKGNIIIPRFKTNSREEIINFDDEIIKICNDFCNVCNLELPFNIQFKYQDNVPFLLEINTRMSGGIQLSCVPTGINIPRIAVNKLLGICRDWNLNCKEHMISHIESPIIL